MYRDNARQRGIPCGRTRPGSGFEDSLAPCGWRFRGAVLAQRIATLRVVRPEGVSAKMRVTACPFCGVPTDVPHETQQLCIAALHGEIALMRAMVRRVKDPQRAGDSQESPTFPIPPDQTASGRD